MLEQYWDILFDYIVVRMLYFLGKVTKCALNVYKQVGEKKSIKTTIFKVYTQVTTESVNCKQVHQQCTDGCIHRNKIE